MLTPITNATNIPFAAREEIKFHLAISFGKKEDVDVMPTLDRCDICQLNPNLIKVSLPGIDDKCLYIDVHSSWESFSIRRG